MIKLDSKAVVKKIWVNAAVSIAFASCIVYFIVAFAELSINVAGWHSISRGVLGLSICAISAWAISHAAGMINMHRRQMEDWKKKIKKEGAINY